jgi:hypothetical protein
MAILTDAINGVTKLFVPSTEENPITDGEHLWGTVAVAAASTVAASMFTRKRVAAGNAPVAGFLF